MQTSIRFAVLVSKFLLDYLPLQRAYSKNTILSYRDSLKLFLRYVSQEKQIKVNDFSIRDFNRSTVLEFLTWYQKEGAGLSAANQRLAALKSFSQYLQSEQIEFGAQMAEILSIKAPKAVPREIRFLTPDQVSKLINKPDARSSTSLRHRAVMTLLYDSGCRVQELCDLTVGDVSLEISLTTVRLHGKGSKYRTVAVSQETGTLLKIYKEKFRKHALRQDPFFINRQGLQLKRDGVGYILNKYAEEVRKECPRFPKKIHCHMLRHSKAMHMLEANINIVYIRDLLGHEDVATTMIYVKNSNRLKEKAINESAPKLTDCNSLPDWNKDSNLMEFLNSLT